MNTSIIALALLCFAPITSGFGPSARHPFRSSSSLSITSTSSCRQTIASTHEEDLELTRKVILDHIAATDLESDGVVDDGDGAPSPKAKKSKTKKKTASAPAAAAGPVDISKLNIIVGVITKAWEHEKADKLFCEEIDVGEDEPRQIASGLRAHYSVDDLMGRKVCILANLKSRKLMGFPSHGMVLCASSDDGSTVKFVTPPEDAAVGERILVDGYEGEPATENQVIKKKMLDAIFPDLRTDANGVAAYKGVPLTTSAGECVAEGGFRDAQISLINDIRLPVLLVVVETQIYYLTGEYD